MSRLWFVLVLWIVAGLGGAAAQPAVAPPPEPVAAEVPPPIATPEEAARPAATPAPEPAAAEILPPIAPAEEPEPSSFQIRRNFAGSVQLDYLAVPTDARARRSTFDGSTVEVSLKVAVDIGDHASVHVKVCVACHGPEFGLAHFELRGSDALNLKVGRFTPALGSFPQRHDPANHRTSDKPLPYDMGRMLAFREWNEGVLPAPWVDNGVELFGTKFMGEHQVDYAAYVIGGPKGTAEGSDFDYTLSRSGERYYVDNNSQPSVGGRVGTSLRLNEDTLVTLGSSVMAGHYDPDAELGFLIVGFDLSLQLGRSFLRAEYLARWTELAIGDDPARRFKYGPSADGQYDDVALKDGFYVELEVPVGAVDLIGRWDGLRRFGNVLADSPLRSESVLLRYTGGVAVRIPAGMRVKASAELYDFSDLDDQLALHAALVGSF